MASFFLFDASTTARTLTSGEFGFIGQLGSLAVSGAAISSTGNVEVTLFGSLFATSSAIDHSAGSFVLQVGKNGTANSSNDDTFDIDFTTSAFVSNDGSLLSGSDALDIRGNGLIEILNTGSISGRSDGIVTSAVGAIAEIVNHGSIAGGDGGIDHLDGGGSRIVNFGSIVGDDYGISGGDRVDVVRNAGTIEGGVITEDRADRVVNSGEIDRVLLGTGDDVYIGRGAGSADLVDASAGKDTLRSSQADDTFVGGGGGDVFIFGRHGGSDVIRDFGGDKINLSALGIRSFAALRADIENVSGGSLIDLSEQYDLSIFLRGVAKAELDGGDFIL